MSDLSVLAHQYDTAADLSQAINQAVIVLKKVCGGLPGAEAVSAEELRASRDRLGDITTVLAELLDPKRLATPVDAAQVTGALITRLQSAHQGDLAYFVDDLRKVSVRLHDQSCKPSVADLDLLDQLASAADAETSHVFRRLMRT